MVDLQWKLQNAVFKGKLRFNTTKLHCEVYDDMAVFVLFDEYKNTQRVEVIDNDGVYNEYTADHQGQYHVKIKVPEQQWRFG